jgi:hypothetical protein
MEGRASKPDAWPEPFGTRDGGRFDLVDLGGGHFVRAREGALSPRTLEAAS